MSPNLYWTVIFCRRTELMSQGRSKSQSLETGEVCHEAVHTGSWGTQTLRACPASPARACVGMTHKDSTQVPHARHQITHPTQLEGIQLQRPPTRAGNYWKVLTEWAAGMEVVEIWTKYYGCPWPQVSTVRLWDLGERTSFVSYCLFKART